MSDAFSQEQILQLKAIVRDAVREEMGDVGLRIDNEDHQDDVREDLRFVRRLRKTWDSAAGKVGTAVLTAVIGIVFAIMSLGFWQWIKSGGGTP